MVSSRLWSVGKKLDCGAYSKGIVRTGYLLPPRAGRGTNLLLPMDRLSEYTGDP